MQRIIALFVFMVNFFYKLLDRTELKKVNKKAIDKLAKINKLENRRPFSPPPAGVARRLI